MKNDPNKNSNPSQGMNRQCGSDRVRTEHSLPTPFIPKAPPAQSTSPNAQAGSSKKTK
jgi:hypothetical protein